MRTPRPALAALSLALSVVACGAPDGPPPSPPRPVVTVVTVRPERAPVEEVLSGRVSALRVAELRPQVGGIVRRRLFTEGQQVEAGQRLYQIDPSVYRAEVASAQANLERRRAGLELAKREAERTKALLQRGAATAQTADSAETSYALAQADLAEAEAALTRSELSLGYASVLAPIAGRIGISRVSEGALVAPSDPLPLATIQQVDEVYVDLKQSSSRYEALRAAYASGQVEKPDAVAVTVLSLSGAPYAQQGKLVLTDISVDEGTGDITLRVLVPNPETRLLPGMFVRARLTFGYEPQALLVPQQAVQRHPSLGTFVLVVDAADKVVLRPVRPQRLVDGRYVVAEGLVDGDRVVVEGADKAQPGAVVATQPFAGPAPSSAPPPPVLDAGVDPASDAGAPPPSP